MADIILETKIPSTLASRALDYLNKAAGKNIEINITDLMARWDFSYQEKQAGETNKQYAERVIRELVKGLMRAIDLAEDSERYNTEVSTLVTPNQDVPDNIVE